MTTYPVHRRRGTLERQHKNIRAAYDSGETDSDIAVLFEVSPRSVGRWRKLHGLQANSRRGRTYATWHYRLRLLMDEGRSVAYCAELLGKNIQCARMAMLRLRRKEANVA